MRFSSIAFLAGVTISGGGGGVPVVSDSSHAGPSGFTNTLVVTPPAGMAVGDHLVLVGYWDGTYSSSDVGTFTDSTPASWLAAPSVRRLLISDSFGTVPGNITLTFGGGGIWDFSVWSVSNILTTAVLGSGTGTTGSATGARDHAYTTGTANSLVVGFIDFTNGSVSGADTSDAAHEWDLTSAGGYQKAFGGVRAGAGSHVASLAPVGAASGSEYGWVEIGAA